MEKIIITCTSGVDLARVVAQKTHKSLATLEKKTYSLKEFQLFSHDLINVTNKVAFVLTVIEASVNESIYELFQAIQLINQYSPKEIILILPYLYYSRQDKDIKPHSNGLKLLLNLLPNLNIKKIATLDIHAKLNVGALQIINLHTIALFAEHIKKNQIVDQVIIVSPDIGGVDRVRSLSYTLNVPLLKLTKIREQNSIVYNMQKLNLDPTKIYLIIDDIVDSGNTLIAAAKFLQDSGAKYISSYCTHNLLNQEGIARIESSIIKNLFITNSLNINRTYTSNKIKILDVSDTIANFIQSYQSS